MEVYQKIAIYMICYYPVIVVSALLVIFAVLEIQYYFKSKKLKNQLRYLRSIMTDDQYEMLIINMKATSRDLYDFVDELYSEYQAENLEGRRAIL